MGDGARRAQMERRFGLGQPVDTYGTSCPHAEPTIHTKQEFVCKSKIGQGPRVRLPRDLINAIGKGGVQVEIIDPETGKTYNFYRELRYITNTTFHIPEMVDINPGKEVIVKIKSLSKFEFIRQLDSKVAEMIKLNDDGNVKVNLDGKELPIINDFKYDYVKSVGSLGGAKLIGFEVKDVFGGTTRFRIYDNGYNEPRIAVFAEKEFRFIEDIHYDANRDAVIIKYYRKNATAGTTIRFMKPGEIDLDRGIAPEEMRFTVKNGSETDKGKVGERIAAKFVKEKLNAIVYDKKKSSGVDRELLLNNEPAFLEAKLTTYKSQIEIQYTEALYDVCRRFKKNSRYKQGAAVVTYFNKDTGFFDLIYRIVTPETQDKVFSGLQIVSSLAKKIKALGIDLETKNGIMFYTYDWL